MHNHLLLINYCSQMLLSDYVIHASMPPAASKSELYVSKKI